MSGTWIHQFQLQDDQKFFNLWCMFLGSNLIINLCFLSYIKLYSSLKTWCNIICSLQQNFLSFFFTITSSFSFVKLLVDIMCPWCLFFSLQTDESLRTQPATKNFMFSLYFWFWSVKCAQMKTSAWWFIYQVCLLLVICKQSKIPNQHQKLIKPLQARKN